MRKVIYTYFLPLQVDNNVTRHLDKVLKRGDWDVLILHYLGLDHIGHISGPGSPLIGRKLSEMDNILMKIHTSLLSKVRLTFVHRGARQSLCQRLLGETKFLKWTWDLRECHTYPRSVHL